MSRIGKLPVSVPEGVTIKISRANLITVTGPKGELTQQIDEDSSEIPPQNRTLAIFLENRRIYNASLNSVVNL